MSEMTDERAAEVLAAHNEWRRYDGFPGEPGAPPMGDPAELGQAIDHVVSRFRSQPPAEAKPVAWQFQDRDGKWHGFMDERHRQNTIADGSWPVRALYTAPPSAPVGVDGLLADLETIWHSVSDDKETTAAYERLKIALAQQPAAANKPAG